MTSSVRNFLPRPRAALAGVALLALGGAIGAGATHLSRPPAEAMAPATPVPIASLASAAQPWIGEPVVAVRGRVVQVYGDNFVLNDGSGQALIEMGRRGEDAALAPNQVVTVQGRYADGVIRASYLVGADGRIAALGRGGPRGGHRHGGPDRRGDDRPAPPAPPTDGNAAAPTT